MAEGKLEFLPSRAAFRACGRLQATEPWEALQPKAPPRAVRIPMTGVRILKPDPAKQSVNSRPSTKPRTVAKPPPPLRRGETGLPAQLQAMSCCLSGCLYFCFLGFCCRGPWLLTMMVGRVGRAAPEHISDSLVEIPIVHHATTHNHAQYDLSPLVTFYKASRPHSFAAVPPMYTVLLGLAN